jgi:hypothetical protein
LPFSPACRLLFRKKIEFRFGIRAFGAADTVKEMLSIGRDIQLLFETVIMSVFTDVLVPEAFCVVCALFLFVKNRFHSPSSSLGILPIQITSAPTF